MSFWVIHGVVREKLVSEIIGIYDCGEVARFIYGLCIQNDCITAKFYSMALTECEKIVDIEELNKINNLEEWK